MYEEQELRVGQEVWFKVVYCESTKQAGGARERWRQSWVTHINPTGTVVSVRWYETPMNEVRRALMAGDVKRSCPGEPLFSC